MMMLIFHIAEELLLAAISTEEMWWSVTVRNWPLNFLYVESISFVRIKSNTRLVQIDGDHHHNDEGRNFFLPLPNDSWLLMLFDLIDWLLLLLSLMLWNDDDDDRSSSFLLVLNCLLSLICRYLIWLTSPFSISSWWGWLPTNWVTRWKSSPLHLHLSLSVCACTWCIASLSSFSDQRNLQLVDKRYVLYLCLLSLQYQFIQHDYRETSINRDTTEEERKERTNYTRFH